jgi:heat shock protein HslJ
MRALSAAVALAGCAAAPPPQPQPPSPLGSWILATLEGAPLETPATLNIGPERAEGVAPCNRFAGGVRLDGAALGLGPLVATRRICPRQDLEDAYLGALSDVVRFARDGDRLALYGGPDDRLLATFEAVRP